MPTFSFRHMVMCLGIAPLVASTFATSACGGTAAPDPPAAGGTTATGGTRSSGGAAPDGGTGGGPSGSGGKDASGGATSGGASGCPAVPIQKLLPIVGPFQYGPDPGPCTFTRDNVTSTYEYTDGLATSLSLDGGETYLRDGQGRVSGFVYPTASTTVAYSPGSFLEEGGETRVRYTVDDLGYVTTAEQDEDLNGTFELTWTYEYENCRLVKRIAPPGRDDRLYSYDAVGHVESFTDGNIVSTFDYSCWP